MIDLDAVIEYVSSDCVWALAQFSMAAILGLFYWYAGGRDFFRKVFTYQSSLPLSIISSCSALECDVLCQIVHRLDICKTVGKEYISSVIMARLHTSNHKIMESLTTKGYLMKVDLISLSELERIINEIRPKQIEMERGYQYYLVCSKFSHAICSRPTRRNDFMDRYEEF